MTPRLGGRLFQQYVVDAFSSIEQTRLWWFRKNQTILRNELYSHICDSVRNGDLSSANVGKGVNYQLDLLATNATCNKIFRTH